MTWLFLERLGVDVLVPDSLSGIARAVASEHNISVNDLRGPQRARRFAWPRQEAMAMAMATGRYSTTQVGRYFGDRDHTTVIHAVRRHAERSGATCS